MADPKIKGSTNENLGKISVNIEPDEPKNFSPKLGDIKDKALNLSRFSEQGIVNEKTGASVVIRDDGQINLASSKYAQVKVSPNGRLSSTSMESITITNRRKVNSDEVAINEHKMNPQLWELADFRKAKLTFNPNAIVGNLCMFGSVLVKAWDPLLKRYMLIRRPWLGPVFGPLMNVPEINAAIKVNDPMDFSEDILALSDKGYQVNAAITDPDSIIGKPGKDRPGIIRSGDALTAAGADSSGSTGWNGSTTKITAADQLEFMHKFGEACVKVFKKEGWKLPASVCIAQACEESGFGQSARAKQDQNYLGIGVNTDASVGGQYNSVEACIWTWGRMMSRPDGYYTDAYNQYQSDHNPYSFIAAIAPRYASASNYTEKVSAIIKGNSFLTDYDKQILQS